MYSRHAHLVREGAPRYAKAIDEMIRPMPLPEEIPTLKDLAKLREVSPYFCEERSDAWRTHFAAIDPKKKSSENNKRRLWSFFADARFRRVCAYCWVPVPMCMCDRIMSRAADVQNAMKGAAGCCEGDGGLSACGKSSALSPLPPRPEVKVTMILHSAELLRMTNSAHLAAMLMNAAVVVWGFPLYDEHISKVGRYWVLNPLVEMDENGNVITSVAKAGYATLSEKRRGRKYNHHRSVKNSISRRKNDVDGQQPQQQSNDQDDSASDDSSDEDDLDGVDAVFREEVLADRNEMSVLLYPAVDISVSFDSILSRRAALVKAQSAACEVAMMKRGEEEKAAAASSHNPNESDAAPSSAADDIAPPSVPSIHIYLSDGTWSQARVVNRQVRPEMPRVALDISPRYQGLFEGLRKRTRETGVSTLEATTIAVSQAIAFDIASSAFSLSAADVEMVTKEVMISTVATAPIDLNAMDDEGEEEHVGETKRKKKRAGKQVAEREARAEAEKAAAAAEAQQNGEGAEAGGGKSDDAITTATVTIPSSVHKLEGALFDLMKQFVEIVSIISTKPDARTRSTLLTPEEIQDLVDKENAYKVERQRIHESEQYIPTADDLRDQLPAPVANYCYVCDYFIGFERMVQHVAGKEHKRKVVTNPKFEPTEQSKRHRRCFAPFWGKAFGDSAEAADAVVKSKSPSPQTNREASKE